MKESDRLSTTAALLTALGLYDRMAKYAGAGTGAITGFANSMVSPALEFKSEGFVTGLGAKLFSIAGPVLVFGVSASVLYGLVLSGLSPDGRLVEIVELPGHPWFVGVQFHPELKSRPNKAHPLFRAFIAAAKENRSC